MSRQELDDLIVELAGPQEARREQARHQRRGTERRRAARAGPRPRLTNADRILATVSYLRRLCTQAVLGELFAVDRSRVTEAIREMGHFWKNTDTPSHPRPPGSPHRQT